MRAVVFDGTLHVRSDYPNPIAMGDQALLKIRRAGVCNTDLELVGGYLNFSGVLGHEFVAEVIDGDPAWIGQRVVGEINIADGTCDFCQRGIPSQCRNRTVMGIAGHQGAFAETMALTARNLYRVPDNVSDDQAVFVEPLAAAFQILEAQHISPRDRIIILGVGKLGMLCAQVLKLTGADVVGVARREKQAALLSKWHIPAFAKDDLPRNQADIVVDCTGTAEGFADALDLVQARGTIILKSTYHGVPQANLTRIAVDELRIIGSRCGPFDAALRALAAGLIDVESLIEARYRLDDAERAFVHAGDRGVLKVLLDV
ncbi:MAG: alcohol dehydrogenase catalytic domain-containing protein [Chloroflexota bacterium]|nr:alcohol dehydrogenase catalytic domain-containing protein [Chloroflexota bacterium]